MCPLPLEVESHGNDGKLARRTGACTEKRGEERDRERNEPTGRLTRALPEPKLKLELEA